MFGAIGKNTIITRASLSAMLVGSVLLAGCAPDVKELRQQAVDQYRNRQYIESMATLQEILETKHSDAEANYYMGLNYRSIASRKFQEDDFQAAQRRLDTAIMYFTQAIKSWPNYIAAAAAKNEALEARGRYEAALRVAQRVAENNKGIWEHHLILGNEYRERGDYDNALRSYKIALSTAPQQPEIYKEMSVLYTKTGDQALALDSLRRAQEIDSDDGTLQQQINDLDVPPAAATTISRGPEQ